MFWMKNKQILGRFQILLIGNSGEKQKNKTKPLMIIFQIIQWNLPLVYTVFMMIMQKSQRLEIKRIDTCCVLNIHILYKYNTKWSFLSCLIIKKVNLYHSGCMTLTVQSFTNLTLNPSQQFTTKSASYGYSMGLVQENHLGRTNSQSKQNQNNTTILALFVTRK